MRAHLPRRGYGGRRAQSLRVGPRGVNGLEGGCWYARSPLCTLSGTDVSGWGELLSREAYQIGKTARLFVRYTVVRGESIEELVLQP